MAAPSGTVSRPLDPASTAVLLIGFQNDFFGPDGVLRADIERTGGLDDALASTVALLDRLSETEVTLLSAPIGFSDDYDELVDPIGIFSSIKSARAFRRGTVGADVVDEFSPFAHRIQEVFGRRGMDAFAHTQLDSILRERKIHDVIVAGALSAVCIDSTARSAVEHGYRVTVLEDCVVGRTVFEHRFYCDRIFPIYAEVDESPAVLDRLRSDQVAP